MLAALLECLIVTCALVVSAVAQSFACALLCECTGNNLRSPRVVWLASKALACSAVPCVVCSKLLLSHCVCTTVGLHWAGGTTAAASMYQYGWELCLHCWQFATQSKGMFTAAVGSVSWAG